MTRALLELAVRREVLEGHDGRSGARLERAHLADGASLIVKTATVDTDITYSLTGGIPRERRLWEAGALDRLTGPVAHPILDVWDEGDATVTLMRDLGDAVPGWSRTITRAECHRILDAMAAVHVEFADDLPADLCPLATRLGLLGRTSAATVQSPLTEAILQGWERFAELVPEDLAAAVFALHADPTPLATAMQEGAITLVHADLWLVNLAIEPDRIVLLDWAVATAGPPALDLAVFLTGSAAHVEPSREELVAAFAARSPLTDQRAIDLALLFGCMDLSWNKALDATGNDDPAVRDRELADLRWWQARATEALDRGLL